MKFPPVSEQIEYLRKGAAEIITEPELRERLERSASTGQPLRVKAGFDPTAPDLHLGHTVLLRKLKHFQDLGHEVYFLIGDFTGMIGDPTGRSVTRPPLSPAEIARNAETYRAQVFHILHPERTRVVFNSEWFGKLSSADMVRLLAQYTVARMLERDEFEKRFAANQPISIHEFVYPLAQGYDSVALHADVELGGTDQRFNLLVGRDLQREYGQPPQIVLTTPLLEGLDGVQKMSKSLGNYVGIAEPPAEMFGKLMSISDDLMWRYMLLLTDRGEADIAAERAKVESGARHPMHAKKALAQEIVAGFHGPTAAAEALHSFERTVQNKELPDEIPTTRYELTGGTRSLHLPKMLAAAGLAGSVSEGERLLKGGAVSLDGEVVETPVLMINGPREMIVRVGKRRFARVRVELAG
jgi:tyrosyl-tRNA synthetase